MLELLVIMLACLVCLGIIAGLIWLSNNDQGAAGTFSYVVLQVAKAIVYIVVVLLLLVVVVGGIYVTSR